jgi:pimeloyl-ACP methyl ester carboxylesterase
MITRPFPLRLTVVIGVLAGLALAASGCSSTPSGGAAAQTSIPPQPKDVVWLCRPGVAPDPCTDSLTATSVNGAGQSTTLQAQPATDPKIDCFYVYPTVSEEPGPNANLVVQPQETGAAIAQVSRFSQACRVYAPMYPQATLSDIGPTPPNAEEETAYQGLLKAWNYYINYLNDGRGFVIIGHSQGAELATNLVQKLIDPNAALRKRLVSAVILGGNLLVKTGQRTGGFFENIPTCATATETGCVIAYSTFYQEPPSDSRFGRAEQGPGAKIATLPPAGTPVEVACVNPAQLLGQSTLDSYFPTASSPAETALHWWPSVNEPTTWVTFPGLYSGQCMNTGGAQWLQITVHQGPVARPTVSETLGPTWGLHLSDANLLSGDLVSVVQKEAVAYQG